MSDTQNQDFETAYSVGFKLILHAGDAKSKAQEAIQFATNYEFDKANIAIREASKEMKEAHLVQTKLIQDEANGEKLSLNILLVHAQDHFVMAMMAIENAKQMVSLMKKVYELEMKVKGV